MMYRIAATVLRLRAGEVGFHQAGGVGQQAVFPGRELDPAFDQAAQYADVLRRADAVAAHHHIALELQAEVFVSCPIGQLHALPSLHALPLAEAAGDQSQGVEHVDLGHSAQLGAPTGHIHRCDISLIDRVGLDGADHRLAVKHVERLGAISGGKDAGNIGLQVFIGEHALQAMHARAFEKTDIGLDAGRRNHQIGGQTFAGGQAHGQRGGHIAGVGFDGLDARAGVHRHALVLHPVADHAARGFAHHARHHAVAHFHHGKLHPAAHQTFHDDAADEARTKLDDPRAGHGELGDGAGIFQCPAGMHPLRVNAGNTRQRRRGPGGDQQGVEGQRFTGFEGEGFARRVERLHPRMALADADLPEVLRVFAQPCAALGDVAVQQVGNRHARIRRPFFVADQGDGVFGGAVLAQGFCSNDARRAVTDDDVVFHVVCLDSEPISRCPPPPPNRRGGGGCTTLPTRGERAPVKARAACGFRA